MAAIALAVSQCQRSGPVGADAGAPGHSATPVHTPTAPTTVVLPGGVSAPASFADLAAKADLAVVFVRTQQSQEGRTGRRRIVQEGLGSAFVYDPDGLILTNHHVIASATDIWVVIGKERDEIEAKVIGRDPPTDVAVLRVDRKGLPHLPLGDSDATRVGDWVVAIGNPFGLAHTVSAGIVSAKGRTSKDVPGLGDGTGYYNFIQTDASINQGNSGGPLIDTTGRVVGINTAIRARANNIGFAVPINMVKELLPRLVKDGEVKRSAIGIVVAAVADVDLARLGIAGRDGALVRRVLPGGPAARAGLAEDDVIVAFDGKPVPGPERLRWEASMAGVGRTVPLEVRRGKRTFNLQVQLGELPPSAPAEELPNPFDLP